MSWRGGDAVVEDVVLVAKSSLPLAYMYIVLALSGGLPFAATWRIALMLCKASA